MPLFLYGNADCHGSRADLRSAIHGLGRDGGQGRETICWRMGYSNTPLQPGIADDV